MTMRESFLIVPGLHDSDAEHWQSRWQECFGLPRMVQRDWNTPDIDLWAQTLERHVRELSAPVVILAHSFGCLTTAFAAARLRDKIGGALLVAPADPVKFGLEHRMSNNGLPFPSIVVASRNDPWITLDRANDWADRWESSFVDLGKAGHINSESGFGDWSGGWELARSLTVSPQPVPTAPLASAEPAKFKDDSMRLE